MPQYCLPSVSADKSTARLGRISLPPIKSRTHNGSFKSESNQVCAVPEFESIIPGDSDNGKTNGSVRCPSQSILPNEICDEVTSPVGSCDTTLPSLSCAGDDDSVRELPESRRSSIKSGLSDISAELKLLAAEKCRALAAFARAHSTVVKSQSQADIRRSADSHKGGLYDRAKAFLGFATPMYSR
eukprot:TRINITY_DN42059_c0_g1_i1.p1 TRINITY_DN42059_c0_g1~~TRINITY_DN42059_c0_g1_i1.p1  ORF type:complete len:185 (-),score=14.77 TRINITY_DN42059_c0_g1_i1:36-590(-)